MYWVGFKAIGESLNVCGHVNLELQVDISFFDTSPNN